MSSGYMMSESEEQAELDDLAKEDERERMYQNERARSLLIMYVSAEDEATTYVQKWNAIGKSYEESEERRKDWEPIHARMSVARDALFSLARRMRGDDQ